MKKFLIISGVVISIIIIVIFGLRIYTKSFSPEDQALYKSGDAYIEIDYCRPSKRDRDVFGELLPYGEVWRTGANEATTIELNKDFYVNNELLKAGKYSLFTIPNPDVWTIIFNEQTGQWGTVYNENRDVLRVNVESQPTPQTVEVFTIEYEKKMDTVFVVLKWDNTLVKIPFAQQ